MLKKFILTSSILALTSTAAVANPAPYVGASLGINTTTSSSVAVGADIPAGQPGHVISQPGYFRGAPFNIFAGFGGVITQNFYLAGEVTGTVGTAEISNHQGLKQSYGYGASVIPGFLLCDHTLLFARLGIVDTRFSDADTLKTGGQYGLGMQTSLTQNVDIRGEYDFTSYGSLHNSLGRISSPRTDAATVGLIYKFD